MKHILILLLFVPSIQIKAQEPGIINYLNQKSPVLVAEVFAPGIISTGLSEHSAPAFSPDGKIVVWTVMDKNYRGSLLEMKFENGSWSKPARPSFADTSADDYYASFTSDGKTLFFSSRRKVPPGYSQGKDMSIWQVERTGNKWGKAVPLDTSVSKGYEYAHSVSGTGAIYFSSTLAGHTNMNIRKSEKINGNYVKPALLPFNINSVDYEDGPYISPDESYLIFESQRPGGIDGSLDLYISFKGRDGGWGIPGNMGPRINSGSAERFARLSPDGKYLFFGSSRNMSDSNWGFDIFWIDAKVIDDLRNQIGSKNELQQPLSDEIIEALDNNNVKSSSALLEQWLGLYPNSLDGMVVYSSVLRKEQRFQDASDLLNKVTADWKGHKNIILEKALISYGLNKDDEAGRLLTPILSANNQLRETYMSLSNSLFDMAKFEQSDSYFEKAMAISSHGVFWYNRACGYAHIGKNDNAFSALEKAIALGYNKKKDFEDDPDLKTLRSDERWKKLSANLR